MQLLGTDSGRGQDALRNQKFGPLLVRGGKTGLIILLGWKTIKFDAIFVWAEDH